MKRLGAVRIGDVLADWGEHEIEGRLVEGRRVPRGYLDQFIGPRRRLEAIRVVLQARLQVVAATLAANPTEWLAVEVSKTDGPMTIFDGLHRMAAWVAHLDAGRDYPIKLTVVVTPEIAPQFEMPP